MTSRSYFGKMNSTLGSVVPLAMFLLIAIILALILALFLPSYNVSGTILKYTQKHHKEKRVDNSATSIKRFHTLT